MSKGLEALEKLYPKTTYMPYYTRSEKRAFCKIIEKELKALEIIKSKLPDMAFIKSCQSYDEYINDDELKWTYKKDYILTEKEYDLLKKVLI